MNQPTHGSLFAGIGGFELAFQSAGFKTTWQVEKDPFCQQVLARHFPDVTRHGDIYDCHHLSYVDVITAGFPCQPFSGAGKQLGRDDERFLVPEMMRVINDVQPIVVLLENVTGFASLNNGAEFKSLLRALAQSGYDAEWGHLRAESVGAPHRRERWFLVAYRHSQRRGEIGEGSQQTREWTVETGVISHANGFGQHTANLAGGSPTAHYEKRNGAKAQQRWDNLKSRISQKCAVSHTAGARLQNRQSDRRWSNTNKTVAQHERCGVVGHSDRQRAEKANCKIGFQLPAQPEFCRDAHGLSTGLYGHIFPVGRGIEQPDYEPPHTADRRLIPNRTDRLQALGNAVVPQVVIPLAIAIRAYLEGEST
jgi:DNA (cytosine-5)-methyltransferase 1